MQPYGVQSMLKEGYKHLSGLEEAVLKNIDACKQLSTITRTSLGPNGTSLVSIFLKNSFHLYFCFSIFANNLFKIDMSKNVCKCFIIWV